MNNKKKMWLVAVSGGPDSMALLDMCLKKEIPVAVGHVNYHHRKQAEEEEEYIRLFCQKNNIPLFVRNEAFVQKGNFEADAREWRYDYFVKVVKENDLEGVLIAHQEDDLLETYLMQKEKHLVPSYYGLASEMMYRDMKVIRPLLKWTKQELQVYCDHNGIQYYIDATNQDTHITRNRIRHEIVENLNREERNALLSEIEKANQEKDVVGKKADSLIEKGMIRIDLYRQVESEVREAALRRLLDEKNVRHLSLAYIREMDGVIMHHRDFMIPYYHQYVVTDQKDMFLWSEPDEYEDVYDSLPVVKPGIYGNYAIAKGEPSVNAVSVVSEDFPLTIRNFHEGDAIEMRFGKKSVARFFVDRHVPLFMRRSWPVVENCKHEIILVPGLGCSVMHYSPKPSFNVLQYTQIEEKDFTCGKKKI